MRVFNFKNHKLNSFVGTLIHIKSFRIYHYVFSLFMQWLMMVQQRIIPLKLRKTWMILSPLWALSRIWSKRWCLYQEVTICLKYVKANPQINSYMNFITYEWLILSFFFVPHSSWILLIELNWIWCLHMPSTQCFGVRFYTFIFGFYIMCNKLACYDNI